MFSSHARTLWRAAPLLALCWSLSTFSVVTPAEAQTYTNPILTAAADPFVTYQNGTYYLLCTDLHNNIEIWSSPSLATLGSSTPISVYDTGGFFESPKLYFFGGSWYIYYTQYPNSVQVLQSDTNNPLGTYHHQAQLTTNTYDANVLQMPGGQLYLLGSTYGAIVIQPLSNPYTVSSGQTTLAVKDQAWEQGAIEAPEPLWHNGQLDILYSAGNYNQGNYAAGALHFNGGDPTNAADYSKLPGPLFTGNPNAGVYDAGVVDPFTSPDGTQTYFVFSDYSAQGAPDSNRCILAKPMTFGPNNDPILGSPIGPGQPVAVPAGDPNGPASPINPNVEYRILNENSGKVVAVSGMSTSPGAQVTQWDDNGTADHNWHFVPLGNGYYHIVNQNSSLLLAVSGASTADSANVTQWTDNGTPDHNWQLVSQGGGYYHIVNQNSQEMLAVQNGSTADGANIQQYYDNGTLDHNWELVPVGSSSTALISGAFYSLTNAAVGLNLDDPNGSNQVNTLLQLWYPNGASAQNWQFNQQTDGSFTLTNQAAGLNLDDPGGSDQQTTQLQLWYPNGATAQEWRVNPLADGNYTLTDVAADLNLDDPGGSNQVGTHLQLWPANNASPQEWTLTRH